MGCKKGEIGCVECKKILADVIDNILVPIHEKREQIIKLGEDYIDDILREGGLRAREVVQKTVAEAKNLVGVPFY